MLLLYQASKNEQRTNTIFSFVLYHVGFAHDHSTWNCTIKKILHHMILFVLKSMEHFSNQFQHRMKENGQDFTEWNFVRSSYFSVEQIRNLDSRFQHWFITDITAKEQNTQVSNPYLLDYNGKTIVVTVVKRSFGMHIREHNSIKKKEYR
jgi:hypothetical protein